MGAAIVQVSVFSCSATTPSGSSGETTGICFNREDSRSSVTAPIPIPTAAGTAYSWNKYLALEVTTTGTTAITDRAIARSSAPPAGIIMYWGTSSAFVTPSTLIAAGGADDTDPDAASTDWTAITTSYVNYSTYSVATVAGRNGNYAKVIIGVSSTATYLGGPGSTVNLPNLLFQYTEAAIPMRRWQRGDSLRNFIENPLDLERHL